MQKKSNLRRFLFNIYAFAFFNKFTLAASVYAIFMQSHGVTDMMLSMLLIAMSVGTLAIQIPITWLTNSLGTKRTIIYMVFCGQHCRVSLLE